MSGPTTGACPSTDLETLAADFTLHVMAGLVPAIPIPGSDVLYESGSPAQGR
jgi:hypothetical protein